MQGLDIIYHEHRELVRLTEAVMAVASEPELSIDRIAAARHALGKVIVTHVLNKQALITATLQASEDPEHRRLAWKFTQDLIKLRQSTTQHYGVWTMERICKDPKGFHAGVSEQRRLLRLRIAWEEKEVFPIVARLLAASEPERRRA
ncbi:hypothetical protein [Sphingomonas sp.]|uniref:hypothetical protein n=1 Tax=Sphingomonas sp. TaxID=28214 RepID=UPI001B1EC503|nr:hypothetical protein [Sphingomonas sp.]MBO9714671.1 hypothetical protein [Sphingomonas sp.]